MICRECGGTSFSFNIFFSYENGTGEVYTCNKCGDTREHHEDEYDDYDDYDDKIVEHREEDEFIQFFDDIGK